MRSLDRLLAVPALLAGTGCGVLPIPALHSRDSIRSGGEAFERPASAVILPPSVDVFRRSDGDGVRSDRRSREAAARVEAVLHARLPIGVPFELRELPDLDDAQRGVIAEHVGLCQVVCSLAAAGAAVPGGEHTLGPGLSFLAEATGAEAAWVSNGVEIGKAVDGESGSRASLSLSLVDLRTGNLLWAAQASWFNEFHDPSLRSEEDVGKLVSRLLAHYPDADAGATPAGGAE